MRAPFISSFNMISSFIYYDIKVWAISLAYRINFFVIYHIIKIYFGYIKKYLISI